MGTHNVKHDTDLYHYNLQALDLTRVLTEIQVYHGCLDGRVSHWEVAWYKRLFDRANCPEQTGLD
jgi:hypothetical protein